MSLDEDRPYQRAWLYGLWSYMGILLLIVFLTPQDALQGTKGALVTIALSIAVLAATGLAVYSGEAGAQGMPIYREKTPAFFWLYSMGTLSFGIWLLVVGIKDLLTHA